MHRNVRRIILLRHGESIGNIDASAYGRLPDNQQPLTEWGKEQAVRAGKRLRNILVSDTQHSQEYNQFSLKQTSSDSNVGLVNHSEQSQDNVGRRRGYHEDVRFFVSPYKRSHETYSLISKQLRHSQYSCVEDPRLREQDWGNFQDVEHMAWQLKERRRFGVFYYRFSDGESGADVYDRVSSFMETLCRDSFRSKPSNYVLISHGITIRMFLARFYHWPVEIVNKLHNFYNGQMVVMERCSVTKDQYTNVHLPRRRFVREASFNDTSFLDEVELDKNSYRAQPTMSSEMRQVNPDGLGDLELSNIHETQGDREVCGSRFLLTSLLMSDPPGPPEQDIWWEKIEERKKTSSPLLGL